ncbi:MAG TPA: class I SAM-dependent methyltransferase, partial [Polyangiaceae bacterium]|nr:class I SAM-dependent methyltransferase [Polyangiaceae bacterium]
MPEPQPLRASIALAAYAEPIVAAGRVLVVGEATTPLVERLLERGARLVHVVDADSSRVAEAATGNADRHVSFAPLGPGGLPVRDGAFDVAIVEDLATLPDPAHVLRQVRRALGARGTALVASRNPEATVHLLPLSEAGSAPDYYAFYDLVTGVFDHVR